MHYNYGQDKKVGDEAETEFATILKKHKAKNVQFNADNKYDISCIFKGKPQTFEVKNDVMSARTGNVAIEFECRGKPSGVAVSKADVWAIKTAGEFWLITKKKLASMIASKSWTRIHQGGDPGSNTKFYLFKKSVFSAYCSKQIKT